MENVDTISIAQLLHMAEHMYGDLVKGVVDIEKELLVVNAQMHADEEQFLLEAGSQQSALWGINLYPGKYGTSDFIEFDSMINIRPRQKNMSRGVEDEQIRKTIIEIIHKKVKP